MIYLKARSAKIIDMEILTLEQHRNWHSKFPGSLKDHYRIITRLQETNSAGIVITVLTSTYTCKPLQHHFFHL